MKRASEWGEVKDPLSWSSRFNASKSHLHPRENARKARFRALLACFMPRGSKIVSYVSFVVSDNNRSCP